jgi:hypothetical protein
MSSINQDITLTQSLADDPRNQLEKWLDDVEIHARNLCAQWDISGALTLVATDEVWAEYPGNVTNLADVIANVDPPDIRVRPTWAAPAAHADNAAAAIVAKYKEAVLKHQAFNQASSALAKALFGQHWGRKPDPPQDNLRQRQDLRPYPGPDSHHHDC